MAVDRSMREVGVASGSDRKRRIPGARRRLRRHVRGEGAAAASGASADVELINEVNYFTFQPLLPEVAAGGNLGARRGGAAAAPPSPASGAPGADLRHRPRAQDRHHLPGPATLHRGPAYDHLVLALGQSVDLSRIPAFAAQPSMKTLSDALTLRNSRHRQARARRHHRAAEVKKELLTFTVIGGGFSGVETAGEMMELIERSLGLLPEHRSARGPRPAHRVRRPPAWRGAPSASTPEAPSKRGSRCGSGPASARRPHRDRHHDRRGDRDPHAGRHHRQRALATSRRLDLPNERGRVRTDRTLRVEGRADIWALGDAALIPLVDAPNPTTRRRPRSSPCARRGRSPELAAALDGRSGEPFYKSRGRARLARRASRRGGGLRRPALRPAGMAALARLLPVVRAGLRHQDAGRGAVAARFDGRAQHRADRRPPGPRYPLHPLPRRRPGVRGRKPRRRLLCRRRGRLRAQVRDAEGRETLRRIGPGGHFGERVLLGEGLRTGTVRGSRTRWCWWSAPRTSSA